MASKEYENIIYEKNPPVAYVTLNRPEKLNSLSMDLQLEVRDALEDAGWEDDEIRVFGGFFGQKMQFLDQTAVQVKGSFDWEEDFLNFSDLQFGMFDGQVQGTALLRLLSRQFDMDFYRSLRILEKPY